jgi:hypothetical protein
MGFTPEEWRGWKWKWAEGKPGPLGSVLVGPRGVLVGLRWPGLWVAV